jgi:hypothetical protein
VIPGVIVSNQYGGCDRSTCFVLGDSDDVQG